MSEQDVRELAMATHDAMETHQGAHAMWGATVESVDGWADCPTCGLTWFDMCRAVRKGRYVCAFSQIFRQVPEPKA